MSFGSGFESEAWSKSVVDNGSLLEIRKPLKVVLTRREL